MDNKYIDLTTKQSTLSKIADKVASKIMILGCIALVIGALGMMNDGKSEIELRVEQSSQR